jgi:hypothetical protein
VHLSILQHPARQIANDFPYLRNRGFPAVLRDHGYFTRFFSAADPAWDGQIPWLRQWYGGYTYDRSRENDGAMLRHMAQWMKDSLSADRPFMVTAMTKTNHYPFNHDDGVRALPADATLQQKMVATMEFTDASIGEFLSAVRNAPWFKNTVFLIMADHGFGLSEHGSSSFGYGLYTESVWIPFVIFGADTKLGKPGLHDFPASQIDVGPTLLDLAGIRAENHFLGHSLARIGGDSEAVSYVVRGEQGSLEFGPYRVHGPLGEAPREQGPELFNAVADRQERRNLLPGARGVYDSLLPLLQAVGNLNTYIVERNALWPDSASPGWRKPATPR